MSAPRVRNEKQHLQENQCRRREEGITKGIKSPNKDHGSPNYAVQQHKVAIPAARRGQKTALCWQAQAVVTFALGDLWCLRSETLGTLVSGKNQRLEPKAPSIRLLMRSRVARGRISNIAIRSDLFVIKGLQRYG